MEMSTNVIKAMAVNDMFAWVSNFENDGDIAKYDDKTQEKYWEYVKKLQKKLLKNL